MENIELMPLGTGMGATTVLYGEPSSSFVILENSKPLLLVDIGYGVVYSYKTIFPDASLPKNFYISHNHSDHSGELPVALMTEVSKGNKINVFSAKEVQQRLMQYRMHEMLSSGMNQNEIANWITCNVGLETKINENLSISIYEAKHSEICFGFILYFKRHPILGFTGDSGFDMNLFKTLSEASTLLCDGRISATSEHAGFNEILEFETSINKQKKILLYITHYGRKIDKPQNQKALEIGKPIKLWPL